MSKVVKLYELHTEELVQSGAGFKLSRLAVEGGWLYLHDTRDGVSMQFVPDICVYITPSKEV